MSMMKSPFNQQLNGTHGHCINALADTPIWIPPIVVSQAIAQGFSQCDSGEPEPVVDGGAAPVETSDNTEVDLKAVFNKALEKALMIILTRDDPTDYKNDMTPKINKVVAEMSPDLRRPTATEVTDAFEKLQENISLAE